MSHNTVARLCAGRALPSSSVDTRALAVVAATTTAAGAQRERDGAGLAAVVGQGAFGDGSGLEPPCFLVLGVLGAAAAHRPPGPNPGPDKLTNNIITYRFQPLLHQPNTGDLIQTNIVKETLPYWM